MSESVRTFAGMRVVVARPTSVTVARSWPRRLLSWPWRPWRAEETQVLQPPVGIDECFKIGDELHCGENFYRRLMADELDRA